MAYAVVAYHNRLDRTGGSRMRAAAGRDADESSFWRGRHTSVWAWVPQRHEAEQMRDRILNARVTAYVQQME